MTIRVDRWQFSWREAFDIYHQNDHDNMIAVFLTELKSFVIYKHWAFPKPCSYTMMMINYTLTIHSNLTSSWWKLSFYTTCNWQQTLAGGGDEYTLVHILTCY